VAKKPNSGYSDFSMPLSLNFFITTTLAIITGYLLIHFISKKLVNTSSEKYNKSVNIFGVFLIASITITGWIKISLKKYYIVTVNYLVFSLVLVSIFITLMLVDRFLQNKEKLI